MNLVQVKALWMPPLVHLRPLDHCHGQVQDRRLVLCLGRRQPVQGNSNGELESLGTVGMGNYGMNESFFSSSLRLAADEGEEVVLLLQDSIQSTLSSRSTRYCAWCVSMEGNISLEGTWLWLLYNSELNQTLFFIPTKC
ncbi:hypothetical protein FF2_022545 [Malus domestica]